MLTFSKAALQELDRRAVQDFHIPLLSLMENAGHAVASTALHLLKKNAKILLLVGPGNNGGDALVAARHLDAADIPLSILLLARPSSPDSPFAQQLAITDAMHLPTQTLSPDHAEFRNWLVDASPSDLIIDGLFGTGLSRPITGPAADLIHAANAAHHPTLAIDIPSGMDADTGQPFQNSPILRATHTLSFNGNKRGFPLANPHLLGKLSFAQIGLPNSLLQQLSTPSPIEHT